MARRRITKSEVSYITITIIGLILFTFISDPISNWIDKFNLSDFAKFMWGIGLAMTVAYFGKAKNYF